MIFIANRESKMALSENSLSVATDGYMSFVVVIMHFSVFSGKRRR
jgi:hypothetical protein